MWKVTTYLMLIFVPIFIALIVSGIKDLIDYKTGVTLRIQKMQVPFPSFTICPFVYSKPLPNYEAFRALTYGNNNELPINMTVDYGQMAGQSHFR